MAHIVEFTIAGLVGNKRVYHKKLNRNLNVFFGLNGSGKTSLLKILHSAMSCDADILRHVCFEWAEVVVHSMEYKKDFIARINKKEPHEKAGVSKSHKENHRIASEDINEELVYETTTFPKEEEGKKVIWQYMTPLPSGAKGQWRHGYLPTWRLGMTDPFYTRRWRPELEMGVFTEEELDKLFAQSLGQKWNQYSAELLRNIKAAQEKGLANILQSILTMAETETSASIKGIDPKMAYQRVSAFLKRQNLHFTLSNYQKFKKKYNANPALRKAVSDINNVETEIEKTSASRAKLEDLIRSMFGGNKKIVFKDTEIRVEVANGQNIPLTVLSSGEKHLVRIFLEVLLAGVSSLLIDEPEISLHIDWQERLISDMQQLSPDSQLVIATHSPSIMAKVSDKNIFKL